jgi:hypothetical protein
MEKLGPDGGHRLLEVRGTPAIYENFLEHILELHIPKYLLFNGRKGDVNFNLFE